MRAKILNQICRCFVIFGLLLTCSLGQAADMAREDVEEIVRQNSSLSEEQIRRLVDDLSVEFGVEPGQRIPIQGVMYAHGMNLAFVLDTDEWMFDATIVDPETKELIKIPNLYVVEFHNGGIKMELAYKWMFTFIPSGMTVSQLDGGVYGRGLGATMEAFFGLEGAWMPGEDRPGHLFHVALKAGFGSGINFPKMEFKKRRIR